MSIQCRTMIEAIIEQRNLYILAKPTYLTAPDIIATKKKILSLNPTMLTANATISLSPGAK